MKTKKDQVIKVKIPQGYTPKKYSLEIENRQMYLYITCVDSDFQELLKILIDKGIKSTMKKN